MKTSFSESLFKIIFFIFFTLLYFGFSAPKVVYAETTVNFTLAILPAPEMIEAQREDKQKQEQGTILQEENQELKKDEETPGSPETVSPKTQEGEGEQNKSAITNPQNIQVDSSGPGANPDSSSNSIRAGPG